MRDVRGLIRNVDSHVEPLARAAEAVLQAVLTAVDDARAALSGVRSVLAEDSPVMFQLNDTLGEINSAARSIRILTDYLERNSNALLVGK